MLKTKKSRFPAAVFGGKAWAARFTVEGISNDGELGSVSGSGSYGYMKTARLAAEPRPGCRFVNWSDGVEAAERSISVSGNIKLTAVFERNPGRSTLVYEPNLEYVNSF